MSELADLYSELVRDHGYHPRNFRKLEGAHRHADGYNPLCGDRITVFLKLGDSTIVDVSFLGAGCAICTASASMMTQTLKGKSEAEAEALFGKFHDLLTAAEETEADESLGKLASLAGVRKYPIRVKCATLPWHTLKAALHQQGQPVSTE